MIRGRGPDDESGGRKDQVIKETCLTSEFNTSPTTIFVRQNLLKGQPPSAALPHHRPVSVSLSPTEPLILSTVEKVAPSLTMTSPTLRSPNPLQKVERTAAALNMAVIPMPGYYRVGAEGVIPITAQISQTGSPPPQEDLVNPKVPARQ